jgi:hypothetical protein
MNLIIPLIKELSFLELLLGKSKISCVKEMLTVGVTEIVSIGL